MIDYQNSKIYKIIPVCDHEEGDIYIGSTTYKYLCTRMAIHKSEYKRWKVGKSKKFNSYNLFDKYGIDNCQIILIEEYPCESKDQLNARERYFIENNKCVNKVIPGRTRKEREYRHFDCECGGYYQYSYKERHFKSKKHLKYLEDQNLDSSE